MKEVFIKVPNEETYRKAITAAMVSPFLFSFPNKTIPHFTNVKKYFHGNSKLLLKLFKNTITGNFEMTITTLATEKTYPQFKMKTFLNNLFDFLVVKTNSIHNILIAQCCDGKQLSTGVSIQNISLAIKNTDADTVWFFNVEYYFFLYQELIHYQVYLFYVLHQFPTQVFLLMCL